MEPRRRRPNLGRRELARVSSSVRRELDAYCTQFDDGLNVREETEGARGVARVHWP
jgi:hypothetical protein